MIIAVEDKAQRTQRGTNAYRHARENYSWRHVASQIVEVYEQHTTRPPPAP
jgi:glycosyltransferase involved in cell wall biosynthesis